MKGYEISKAKFIVVDDDDFKAAAPELSRVLEMTAFVPGESIDPRFFDSPYYLVPREGGDKAYAHIDERENTKVIDLVARLQENLAASAKRGVRKAAAKKSAATKSTRPRKSA